VGDVDPAVVWKYPIGIGRAELKMPAAARILGAGWQDDRMPNAWAGSPVTPGGMIQGQVGPGLCLWALVHPDRELEARRFDVLATGERFNDRGFEYVGSVVYDRFVWHVFEDRS